MNSKNLLFFWISTTPKLNICTIKLAWIFPCPSLFNQENTVVAITIEFYIFYFTEAIKLGAYKVSWNCIVLQYRYACVSIREASNM